MPNRRVVVTGAASGIGRATAKRFMADGDHVLAVDAVQEGLVDLARELESSPGRLEILQGDLRELSLPADILARAGGRVDVLANVAGVMDGFLPAGEVDDATWDLALAVNLTAPMRLMRAVLPAMLAAGKGVIVNVASEAGVRGACAGAAYTAAKHGVVGLTKNSAFLYARSGVRVNAVAPGPVATGMEARYRSQLAQKLLPPLVEASIARIAEPTEIADTIFWLSSDEARNINGAVIMSDGGWSAA
jgi:NAD(P)-dependent dehydrogenase (short-subunit alcohol dehydrogenase family)